MGVLGGRLYVLGGSDYDDDELHYERSVEVLNTNTDTWEVVEPGLEGEFYDSGAIFVEY